MRGVKMDNLNLKQAIIAIILAAIVFGVALLLMLVIDRYVIAIG